MHQADRYRYRRHGTGVKTPNSGPYETTQEQRLEGVGLMVTKNDNDRGPVAKGYRRIYMRHKGKWVTVGWIERPGHFDWTQGRFVYKITKEEFD